MGAVEWGVLFCVVCLIVGSFSYMKPSPKQKREAKIRMKAINSGIRVKQMQVDDLSVAGRVNNRKKSVVFFQLHVPEKVGADKRQELLNTWLIQRTTGESGIYLADGWAWKERSKQDSVVEFLAQFLKKQSINIEAIEVNNYYVGIAWNERPDEVYLDVVIEHLHELMQFSTQ